MTVSWMQIVIGIWVLLSPWFLGWSGIPVIMWSNLLSGVLVIVLGVWQVFGRSGVAEENQGQNPKNK